MKKVIDMLSIHFYSEIMFNEISGKMKWYIFRQNKWKLCYKGAERTRHLDNSALIIHTVRTMFNSVRKKFSNSTPFCRNPLKSTTVWTILSQLILIKSRTLISTFHLKLIICSFYLTYFTQNPFCCIQETFS